jgi:hypothetical protein
MSNTAIQPDPEITKLRAQARKRIHEQTDADSLWRTGPSTTSDINMLVLEAEMIDNGRELDNPHIPVSEDVRQDALARLDDDGLEPGWQE